MPKNIEGGGNSTETTVSPTQSTESLAPPDPNEFIINPSASAAATESTPDTTVDAPKSSLSSENVSFFQTMSLGSKTIFNSVANALNNIPGISRLIAKTQIRYNQFFEDRQSAKAIDLKFNVESKEETIRGYDQAMDNIRQQIDTNQDGRGLAALNRTLARMEKSRDDMDRKKAGTANELLQTESKLNKYENRRREIADGMLDTYAEKLSPIESSLESSRDALKTAELHVAVTEADLRKSEKSLEGLVASRDSILAACQGSGFIESFKLSRDVKELNLMISESMQKIQATRDEAIARVAAVKSSITALEQEARPYQIRKREFEDIKNRRSGSTGFTEDSYEIPTARGSFQSVDRGLETAEESEDAISSYTAEWENYREGTNPHRPSDRQIPGINIADLIETVNNSGKGLNWNENTLIQIDDFVAIAERYLVTKGPITEQTRSDLEAFKDSVTNNTNE